MNGNEIESGDDGVVITAAAACCSLGTDRRAILEAMLQDRVGIDEAPAIEGSFPPEDDRVVRAAQSEPLSGGEPDRAETGIRGVIGAGLREAGLEPAVIEELRAAGTTVEAVFGTTLGGMRHLGHAIRNDAMGDYARTLTATVNRDALEGTGIALGGSTISAACASGVSSMSLGATAILLGEADIVIAVSYDPISEFAFAGFSCLRLVAEGPLRPFTADREGMRVGEGYGVFVLERASGAAARGAVPLARVLGWGAASDAHHLTQPAPDGRGAARAVRSAAVETPDLVIAHATSTPANDAAEYQAMAEVFGPKLREIPVTALKSRIGHTLAAAGSIELAVLIAAMERGRIPAAANAVPDADSFPDLDLVLESREATIERGLVVSLGFGGADAAICVESSQASPPATAMLPVVDEIEDVVVTGVGVLIPDGDEEIRPGERMIDDAALEGLDEPRAVRRLARFARLVRAAGRLAVESAGLDESMVRSAAAFVGTRFGAAEYTLDYYEELIREGLGAGNPLHFAESVPNIGSAQLSLGLGIEGFTLSTSGTRLAGLEAMHLARRHLQSGQADRAIVVAAEETHPRVRTVLQRLRLLDDRPCAEGAVAFLLESRSSAADRGRRGLAHLASTSISWPETSDWRGAADALAATLAAEEGPLRISGADSGRGRPGDRLVDRVAKGRPCSMGDLFERHSVQPMLQIAAAITESNPATVIARDEAGGCGSVGIQSISS
ncbi:MAG: hypothetical protein CMJ34_06375 [Phycisphaerae bacterium]|nr:hypothetical protein [Phycisphaerae bacterium]